MNLRKNNFGESCEAISLRVMTCQAAKFFSANTQLQHFTVFEQMVIARRHIFIQLICLTTLPCLLGCRQTSHYPSRPITIICPWAAGGGTDRVSRQMAMQLERELGVPVNVVNATGGKGVTGHNRGMSARPDGYTITMMTFELNTMHWMRLTELTYQDCIPLASVNEDYAALLVRNTAPWASLADLESTIRKRPGELTASGTAVGGAWHLALAGWLNSSGMEVSEVIWVPSEGANPSLQQLMSGGVDMVCCSLPEARTLLEAGEVRGLGVMAPKRAVGFEEVPTFQEQGNPWTLGGWRGLSVPIGTPQPIVDRLVQAIESIVSRDAEPGTFAEFMQSQKFDNTWRGPAEFAAFLQETDSKLGELLASEAMESVSHDRFDPMTYPYVLMALLTLSLVALLVSSLRNPNSGASSNPAISGEAISGEAISGAAISGEADRSATSRLDNFLVIALSIVLYSLLAEALGFVITGGLLLLIVLVKFGTRPVPALLITLVTVPGTYLLFAYVLRVSLPRGLFG